MKWVVDNLGYYIKEGSHDNDNFQENFHAK